MSTNLLVDPEQQFQKTSNFILVFLGVLKITLIGLSLDSACFMDLRPDLTLSGDSKPVRYLFYETLPRDLLLNKPQYQLMNPAHEPAGGGNVW